MRENCLGARTAEGPQLNLAFTPMSLESLNPPTSTVTVTSSTAYPSHVLFPYRMFPHPRMRTTRW